MRPTDTATPERKPLSGLWRFDAGRRERWRGRPLPGDLENTGDLAGAERELEAKLRGAQDRRRRWRTQT